MHSFECLYCVHKYQYLNRPCVPYLGFPFMTILSSLPNHFGDGTIPDIHMGRLIENANVSKAFYRYLYNPIKSKLAQPPIIDTFPNISILGLT